MGPWHTQQARVLKIILMLSIFFNRWRTLWRQRGNVIQMVIVCIKDQSGSQYLIFIHWVSPGSPPGSPLQKKKKRKKEKLVIYNYHFSIIGGEFCEGYTDGHGVYHSGFQCPLSWEDGSETEEVYCCGTATQKFCCDEPTSNFSSVQ